MRHGGIFSSGCRWGSPAQPVHSGHSRQLGASRVRWGLKGCPECCSASPRPIWRWAARSPFLPDTGQHKTSQQNYGTRVASCIRSLPPMGVAREQARKEQTSQCCTLAGLNRLQRAMLVAQLSPCHPTAPGEHWQHYPHVPWGPQLAEDARSNSRSPSDTLGFVLLCTKMLLRGPGSTEGPRCGCAL